MGGSISEDNTRLPVTIPKDLKERSTFVAKCEHRSLSNLIVAILSNYVDQHYTLYNLLFDSEGREKDKIETERLKEISQRTLLFGSAGTGKSAILDNLLTMYYNEHNQNDQNKSDTE